MTLTRISLARRIDSAGSKSNAFLSNEASVDRVVVFVHGFGGGSVATWKKLHAILESAPPPEWLDSDIFFLDYPSTARTIRTSAARLLDFLREIVPFPKRQLFIVGDVNLLEDSGRDLDAGYSQVVLVGHSLGGVIIRQAVRLALRDLLRHHQEDDLSKQLADRPFEKALAGARLKLFAPAIGGFQPKAGIAVARQFGATAFVEWSRAFQDLRMDSPTLRDLRLETEQLAEKHPLVDGLRADLAWAESDDIVVAAEYFCDDTGQLVSGSTHGSVCKSAQSSSRVSDFIDGRTTV